MEPDQSTICREGPGIAPAVGMGVAMTHSRDEATNQVCMSSAGGASVSQDVVQTQFPKLRFERSPGIRFGGGWL